jgi:hypothetical protein
MHVKYLQPPAIIPSVIYQPQIIVQPKVIKKARFNESATYPTAYISGRV